MIKSLVKDESVLSQPCEKATADDAETAADLAETLASLEEAACLAANQIGVPKAIVAYLDDEDRIRVMLNPVLKRGLQPFRTVETCLTAEGESKVTRFGSITVAYDEIADGKLEPRKAKLEGWTAQIVQHMIDHCKGKLV